MKGYCTALIGLILLLVGCNEHNETEAPKELEISLSIRDISTDTESITFTLTASGKDKDSFERWGVIYSETPDQTNGKEKNIAGCPGDGSTEVTINGLRDNTTYYIWSWAYSNGSGQLYTSEPLTSKTEEKPASNDGKLTGTIIGTKFSVDYNTGKQSTSVNSRDKVFDGNFNTFFASYDRSGTWVGLDLGSRHVITKVGYSPRISHNDRVELAIIEGANQADFSDALPIYMIKEAAASNQMHYGEVNCSRGFRYVRYMTPNDVRCNLSELEFYGFAGEGDDSHLYQITNLPTVVINTENSTEITSKEDELSSNVYIISEDGTKLLATSETGVRGRGNASWNFPKKPYRLKFKSKQSPLDAPASAKKWTLISNYGDKTLMRNILAFEVSRRVGQAYTPYCHPVDLVVNGEYRGCYQLCDQVEAASDRVPAKDGYLIEIDAYAYNETSMFYSKYGTPVTIKHPDEDDITSTQKNHIENFFNRMEQSALSGNFTDPYVGYRKYLDLDSFLQIFMIGEFCGNTDLLWSIYMYKDAEEGKLYAGPTWDHDLSFENDYRSYPINNLGDFIFCTKGSSASETIKAITKRIVKEDPQAKARLIELWEQACSEGDLKNLSKVVDQTQALLMESQELNFKRWDILDEPVHMNFQALGSYEAEVKVVKNYINVRLAKFDMYIRR